MKYYTLKETSEILKVSVRTLRDWIVNGKIKAMRYTSGRILYVPEEEIKRKMSELKGE